MKKIALLTCFLFWAFKGEAQSRCGNDLLLQQLRKRNPVKCEQLMSATRERWQDYQHSKALLKEVITGTDTVYEIPVVVHIMHTGETVGALYNPDDAAIGNLMDYVNKTFAATWPDYFDESKGGTKMPFVFKLARRDPACNTSNGITRTNASGLPGYSTFGICPFGLYSGPSDGALKLLNMWPSNDYYNIWIVNKIENGASSGYSPWPWFAGPDILDGVVIDAQSAALLSGTYSSTLPHEVGHGFGLYHTFQDGCHDPADCLTEGDELCDTEPHDLIDVRCYEGELNTCTGVLYAGVEHNFMNYTTCPKKFTQDQRTRTIFTMNGYRRGLVNSLGATATDPGFIPPKASCTPGILFSFSTLDAGPRNIIVGDMNTSSKGLTGDGGIGYMDRTCQQEAAHLTEGSTYPISISTEGYAQHVAAWVDFNDDGVFQSTELIFYHVGSKSSELHSGSFKVPAGCVTGTNLRMRIKADLYSVTSPCSDVEEGQTEDYTVVVSKGTAIDETPSSLSLSIVPNPAADRIYIEAPVAAQCVVNGLDGRTFINAGNQRVVDVSMLPAGVYMVIARKDNQLIGIEKLVIVR